MCAFIFNEICFHSWCETSHVLAIVSLLAKRTGIGGSYFGPLAKSTLIYFARDSWVHGQCIYYLFDRRFEAVSLTQPWRQISSENRLTLKPYWSWMALKADNTDTMMHSMMHSSATFLLYLQKGCLITEEWRGHWVVKIGIIGWLFCADRSFYKPAVSGELGPDRGWQLRSLHQSTSWQEVLTLRDNNSSKIKLD